MLTLLFAVCCLQVEHWYHRHLPDPRLLLDGDSFLPCQVAARRNHAEAARLLLPSQPITSLFADGDLSLLGPPSLAAIAGAVLRATLAGDLNQVLQQEQEQQDCAEASAEGDAESEAEEGVAEGAPGPAADANVQDDATELAGTAEAADAASSVGDKVCGVCFDMPPQVLLAPCGHQLCTGCCQSLLAMNSRCIMVCPFCRGGVAHLERLHAPAAAGKGPASAAVPLHPEPAFAVASATLVM